MKTIFARKYRPSTFAELLGQDVLVKVLTNEILNDSLSQVYLLTGIRGVGKTTSARIIAKTINCTDQQRQLSNTLSNNLVPPFVSPCDSCSNCESFNNGNHPDIIEIDAASKTGVDDIRSIIESSEYKPLLGIYKVFIIDEVHMLSRSAFNALLKIIEEPPAHVIFIFATTELQKVPLTVISRCQKHDLKRLSLQKIIQLLQYIAQKENLLIDSKALTIIAHKSEGSARDAIMLLDHASSLVSSIDQSITEDLIHEILGITNISTVIEFTSAIVNKNPHIALTILHNVYNSSTNLEGFIEEVCSIIAYIIKTKMIKEYHEDYYNLYMEQIENIASRIEISNLSILWQIYSHGMNEIKTSYNPFIACEMLIIKSVNSISIDIIEEILQYNALNPRQS